MLNHFKLLVFLKLNDDSNVNVKSGETNMRY